MAPPYKRPHLMALLVASQMPMDTAARVIASSCSGRISQTNSTPARVMSSATMSTATPPSQEPRWIHSSCVRLRVIGLNPYDAAESALSAPTPIL